MSIDLSPSDVVTFWKEAGPGKWYAKDEAFDDRFRARFGAGHMAAARRELDGWMETAEGALALMILLDQYPRNSFRGTGHQFATDALALSFAKQAVAHGFHEAVAPDLRQFFLTPYEHSERLEDHDALIPICDTPEMVKWAAVHRDIIARFGRFPHRNKALGRETTAEEQAFLGGGGFGG
jgi:uncharacterized protein (DUF924 family)